MLAAGRKPSGFDIGNGETLFTDTGRLAPFRYQWRRSATNGAVPLTMTPFR